MAYMKSAWPLQARLLRLMHACKLKREKLNLSGVTVSRFVFSLIF